MFFSYQRLAKLKPRSRQRAQPRGRTSAQGDGWPGKAKDIMKLVMMVVVVMVMIYDHYFGEKKMVKL